MPDPTDPPATGAPSLATLQADILRLSAARGADASICPSEVARLHGEGWRSLMARVREAACELSRNGLIDILRKGKPIDPEAVRGVIRLRLRSSSRDAGRG